MRKQVSGPGVVALLGLLVVLVFGCAHPRRSTTLSSVSGQVQTLTAPDDVYRLTVLEGEVPARQRSGDAWDDDGEGLPDPLVRIYRDEELVWESSAVEDSLRPAWNQTIEENVFLPSGGRIRFEMWDKDGVAVTPIGVWRGRGLPESALPGANARVSLDGGGVIIIRVDPPQPMVGTGVSKFEMRSKGFRVLEVIERSPAGRAGLRVGDTIVALDGKTVEELGATRAASELSMAATRRGAKLTVTSKAGKRRDLTLDGGYVWLSM